MNGVHKVLNNNVVITIDALGREQVLMGRGLGFGLKPADPIDFGKVEKTFVLDGDTDHAHTRQVLTEVPYAVIESVSEAIDDAQRTLGRELGRRVPVAIIDHVNFLLERLEKGIRIPAAPMPELAVLYPDEFGAARAMAAAISARLRVEFPPEEATFLTLHLLNATRDEPNGTAALLFRRLQHVVSIVEQHLGLTLDPTGNDYARFLLHVKFLLQRLVSESMLRGGESSFYEFAKHSYPDAHACAEKVKAYVQAETGSLLTDEEMLYIVVHVERLSSRISSR